VTRRRWRILVGSPFPPRLDGRHGGSRAVAQLVAALAARHTVALLVLRDRSEPGVDEVLRGSCELVEEIEIPPVGASLGARAVNKLRLLAALARGLPSWAAERSAPDFEARLREVVEQWEPDIVQLEYRIMGQFLPGLAGVSTPLVLVDPDPDGPDTSSVLLSPVERRAWASLGRAVSEQVDSLVAFTERDRRALSQLSGKAAVVRIPLAYDVFDRPADPACISTNQIVWVGSFIHPPNVDAVFCLVRDIFPAVRARVPDASLDLVGSHATPEVQSLAGDGVTVYGDVPDVLPYLDAAAVLAVPVRRGGGMRVKILEGLAAGKAIVATPLALEGLDLRDGEHVRVAETDGEFVDAVVDLLTDADARTRIASAARIWAQRHLDMDAQVRAYEDLYSSLLRGRSVPDQADRR
jgi:polysaccharide biosynthesis protein PslH